MQVSLNGTVLICLNIKKARDGHCCAGVRFSCLSTRSRLEAMHLEPHSPCAQQLVPGTECGHAPSPNHSTKRLESSSYPPAPAVIAARQIGLQPCDVCYDVFKKVAEHYVRGNKSKGDTSRDELMALAVDACSCLDEAMIRRLTQDLVKELDACILSFFGFHWDHADMLLAAASAV